MVVVVIIGILVAIAIPIYNNVQQSARDRADEANVRILNGATMQWLAEFDSDPDATTPTTTAGWETALEDFLQEWPESPNDLDYEWIDEDGVWVAQ